MHHLLIHQFIFLTDYDQKLLLLANNSSLKHLKAFKNIRKSEEFNGHLYRTVEWNSYKMFVLYKFAMCILDDAVT